MKKHFASIIFVFINIIYSILTIFVIQPIFWKTNSLTDRTIVKIAFLILLLLFLSTIVYIFLGWKREKVYSLLPFFSIIFSLVWIFSSISLPKVKIQPKKTIEFVNINFDAYIKIASEYELQVDKKEGYIQLKPKYRFLTEDGRFEIGKIENSYVFVFTLKSSISYGEFLVYSPNDKDFYGKRTYYEVKKLRENWYFVIEK